MTVVDEQRNGFVFADDGFKQLPPPTETAQWPKDWRSIKRTTDKLAILGHSPSTRDMAPYNDPSYEIWTLNDAHGFLKGRRVTRWFEIHTRNVYRNPDRRSPGYIELLQTFPGPVYMLDHDTTIPNCVAYPKDYIEGKYGRITDRQGALVVEPMLTSGFSYMMAIALEEGFSRIEFYGADLMGEEEYVRQREGFAFLYGMALGKGVQMILPDACPILRSPLYGQNAVEPTGLTEDFLSNAIAQHRNEQGKAAAASQYNAGAADAYTKLRAKFGK